MSPSVWRALLNSRCKISRRCEPKNRPTSDLVSYDLYLRALVPFRTYTREGINEALELLEAERSRSIQTTRLP